MVKLVKLAGLWMLISKDQISIPMYIVAQSPTDITVQNCVTLT